MASPTPAPEPAPQPLDVPALLAASVPRGGPPVTRLLAIGFLMAVLASLMIGSASGRLFAAALLLGGLVGVFWIGAQVVRAHKGEQALLQSVEDFITLRHWQHAAAALHELLSRPMKLEISRTRALIYLSGVLTRYHRFEDAITVQDHLLETRTLDGRGEYAVRLGRAMALLHADRLWDADRAISELRRIVNQRRDRTAADPDSADNDLAGHDSADASPADLDRAGPRTAADAPDPLPAAADSAALALIEMYRDVKTGHPDEVLGVFQAALPVMRRQLGPRLGDAYALASSACQRLGREEDARRLWRDATLLVPPEELGRRYPELQPLQRFSPASRPAIVGPGGPT